MLLSFDSTATGTAMHESLDADSLAEDLLDDALLALLQDEPSEPDRIAPREHAGPAPLSFAQQRLWYLQQFNPQSAAYNLPRALSLKGELHGQHLAMALQAVVDRHDILRSRFAEVEGIPQQFVEADARLEMPCEDLTAMPDTQRPHALQRLIEADALAPFDLGKAPLIRARLVKVQGDEHVLLLNMHHIVSDAWSNPILLQDLLGAYSQAAAQGACKLQRPAIQYADYAIWQRQAYLQSDACQASARYWHTRLGDELQPLMLPGDLDPRCAGAPPEGTSARYHGLQLDAEVFQALLQLSRQQGVQPFVIALAAWQVLLGRYSGQRQFTLGVPSAGRNRSETQQLVGFFVSTQIYRAELDPQQSVQTLLQNLREQSIAALSHSDYPMELYLETLQHNGQVLPTQLFQALFNWRVAGTASGPLALGPLQLDFLDTASAQAKCLIGIDLEYAADGLGFSLEYDCSQFSHATVQRMARHWQNLLLAMARGPEHRLGELDMLGAQEQQITFAQWNPAPAEHPADQALHSRIEAQVQRTPDAIAVTCEGQALSYAQLNQRANALARRLVDDGVGPDVLVGLAAERSLDMVVGIFAILKAGGAYVPLDPAYPADRLDYMIEDSGLQRLLAQPQVLASLPVPAGVRVLSLESNDDCSQADPLACSPVTVSPDNLAYVIYTSGSTGKPKGVLLPQRNVLRLFTATDADFRFGSDDVWSLFHSYAFDFSVWEIFGALLYGGRLVIVPQHTSRSPEAFYQLLADEQVTVLNQTPSAFKQLMAVATTAEPQRPLALRSVVFGGEALDVNSLAPWFERFGDRQPQLVNMYGITETTVHVSYRPLSLADLGKAASSPMGVPIPDLSWYVLDGDLNPVAKGCIGELYVGRAGLARGYLKRSDLSATRFVPDPFGAPGGRLYRTGDLARYHADGVIEYAGRIDHQVKIRGFRIELGEIEARLQAQPQVREALVLAQEGATGQQLVAYLIPAAEVALEQQAGLRAQLREQLKEALPDYMVPAHLLLLDRWPLTANGKLDRKALPKADASLLQQGYRAPRSELEQQLAAIWQDVLKLEQVGLDDHFFELGGHSLLAVSVVSRVQLELGLSLTPQLIFQHPTLASFAEQLAQASAPADTQTLSKLSALLDEMEEV
ncbi:amino acid adenylation domain-containing protein [Pseudomonas sp.]|uniref:amino acid adenylation domain-containing protein n=1 Tax=Pseudomonas sp. TaxID=306 RepID=UPI0029A4AB26|nr:amino acid adenylation domain-containing protein [Pseudomonas sp.]MDX3742944.1 amino acid adenylation domain-containing protein [Pseudomonas sp.]